MKIQVLMTPGCAHGAATLQMLAQLAPEVTIERVMIEDMAEAERYRFPGSPTVLVDGLDVDPDPPRGVGLG